MFFSLNMLVRVVLLDKILDEVPMLVEFMLSKVIEEFENHITSQVELDFRVAFYQESGLILNLRDMMIGLIHEGFQSFFRQLNNELLKQEDITFREKVVESCDDDGCYVVNMDEVDLSIENYEELFGAGHNDLEHAFAKDGIDCLFGGAESNCHGSYDANESSTRHGNQVQPACNNAALADSLISCKTKPNPCYERQHSHISFSSLPRESDARSGKVGREY
ncbi:unnamed protein product [Lactuca saligna]|uniref:Uncharacterized protein n=1 Tax=Lactuca saligna TaxID=75948 RepID=A0AA35ZFY7_LACSI|nr:unnamed protein product [Lactuca saligna]